MNKDLTTTKKAADHADLTVGSLPKKILLFSLPLMASQLLQVLFNMADVAVVGRFSSAVALGSVGSTSTLVTLFTGMLIGLASAVNVIAAKHIGAKEPGELRRTIGSAFVVCTGVGVLIMLACFFLARPMLELIGTKDELIDGAVLYFKIYALGMPSLAIFNYGNAILSAQGDTKGPLVYLTVSGILNVILNLIFVIGLHMSVDGVSLASIISQTLSATLILIRMAKNDGDLKFDIAHLECSREKFRQILALGIPAALQNAIFAVANLFIQRGVNSFDHVMVEGDSAAANADAIVYNVMAAFYTAASTFMGQNLGAGKKARALKSYFVSLAYSAVSGAILGGLLLLFGQVFLSMFTTDRAVADAGMQRIMIMGFSYMLSAPMDCTIAASRGLGKSLVPTIIVIIGSCVFRVTWVYTIFAAIRTIPSLYLLYPFSWSITATAEIVYFAREYGRIRNEE